MYFWTAQAIGIVALGFFVWSFQLKKTKQILTCQTVSFMFWAMHFTMLSAWTGVAVILLNASKTFIFSRYQRRPFWLLAVQISLFVVATLITWEGLHSLFALIGVTFATFSHWQKDSQKLRLLFPPSNLSWGVYHFFVRSYSGIATEAIVLTSVLIGIYRSWNETNKAYNQAGKKEEEAIKPQSGNSL